VRVALVATVGGIVGLLLGVALAAAPLFPSEASAEADDFMFLWRYMVIISGVIFGVVTAALVTSVYLFRGRRGDNADGPPIHGITWLEVAWTLVPTAIVVSIVVFSWDTLNRTNPSEAIATTDERTIPEADGKRTLQVRVAGYRYAWAYDIPAVGLKDLDQLVLPLDQPVKLDLQGRLKGEDEPIGDVIHSFWVPDWRVQMSTVPGRDTSIGVVPTKAGEFPVVCAFICGPGHAAMNTELAPQAVPPIRVVPRAEWEAWVGEQRAAAEEAAREEQAEGGDEAEGAAGAEGGEAGGGEDAEAEAEGGDEGDAGEGNQPDDGQGTTAEG
jgi:cytochrome c oxidase subunit 2